MNMHKELIFPTPIYIFDYGKQESISIALNYIKNIQNKNWESETCWSTNDDLHTISNFELLKKQIMQNVKQVFDDIGLIRESEYITCMWANVSKKLNRHNMHMHSNSFWSGVIYLSAPKNPGNIGFKDPRISSELFAMDYENDSIFRHRTIEVEPIVGRLILFPSWLYHGTRQGDFDDSQERVSLSFNILPKTKITDYSRKMEL